MKMTQTITVAASALSLFLAGCAHEEHHAQYDESISPYGAAGGTVEYNNSTTSSSSSRSGTYGGNYSTQGGASVSSGASAGGTMSESDNQIVTDVRESFLRDPEIAPIVPNLQIVANNGTIILSGSVQSEEQKRQIEALCRRSGKVVSINNQLNISTTSSTG